MGKLRLKQLKPPVSVTQWEVGSGLCLAPGAVGPACSACVDWGVFPMALVHPAALAFPGQGAPGRKMSEPGLPRLKQLRRARRGLSCSS